MAYDKLIDSAKLDGAITATANAIREKTETTEKIAWNPETGFSDAIEAIEVGGSGGSSSVSEKDVNFYDYDGTLLHSYTVAEAQALTELPALPEQPGLVCQGWNWTLEDIKDHNRAVNVGATYTTDDGTTRIYIHLTEGRTSPLLDVSPKGTITVDWGDGTTPDTITGTGGYSVPTPIHEYAAPGDYVIRLTVDGGFRIGGSTSGSSVLRQFNNSDNRNKSYRNSIKKVEIGEGEINLNESVFRGCHSLESISIPNGVNLYSGYLFYECRSLKFVTIPNNVTGIGSKAFLSCSSLESISIPNSVTSLRDDAFRYCYSLKSISIPNGVTDLLNYSFQNCSALREIIIPANVKTVGNSVFDNNTSLSNVVILGDVETFEFKAFNYCYPVRYYDFTKSTKIPVLNSTSVFPGIADDCEIRVPAALYDEWKAATNWTTHASKIVAA